MQYKVTAVIQSVDIDNNKPVDVQWYKGPSLAAALAAQTQAAAHDETVAGEPRYRTLSVTMLMEQD